MAKKRRSGNVTRHGRDPLTNTNEKIAARRWRSCPPRGSPRLDPNGGGPSTPAAGQTRVLRSKSSPKTPFSVVRRRVGLSGDVGKTDAVVGCSSMVRGSVFAADGRRRSARFYDSVGEGKDVVMGCSSVVFGNEFAANGRRRSARFRDSVEKQRNMQVECASVLSGGLYAGNGWRRSSRFRDSIGERGFDVSERCFSEARDKKCGNGGGRQGSAISRFRDPVGKKGSDVRERYGDSMNGTLKNGAEGKKRRVGRVAEGEDARNPSVQSRDGLFSENGKKVISTVKLMQRKRKESIQTVVRRLEIGENTPPANLSHVDGSLLEEVEERKKGRTNVISMAERLNEKGNKKKDVDVQKPEGCCGSIGWTSEQDKALHRAYVLARPSPHFWKKISKMVPGKSAKECFNRLHSKYATPPLPSRRSRANRKTMSPLSRFNLLDGPYEFFKENVRTRGNKKSLAQKTARHILRKHCLVDQGQGADLFSVFETSENRHATVTPHLQASLTSNFVMNSTTLAQNSDLLKSHKTVAVRSMALEENKKPSPEILKKVKNMKLHEKYIDQLHHRDAMRKGSVTSANNASKEYGKESVMPKTIVVKASKKALLSEAREFISKFQRDQAHFQIKHAGCGDIDDDDGNKSEYEDSLT